MSLKYQPSSEPELASLKVVEAGALLEAGAQGGDTDILIPKSQNSKPLTP